MFYSLTFYHVKLRNPYFGIPPCLQIKSAKISAKSTEEQCVMAPEAPEELKFPVRGGKIRLMTIIWRTAVPRERSRKNKQPGQCAHYF